GPDGGDAGQQASAEEEATVEGEFREVRNEEQIPAANAERHTSRSVALRLGAWGADAARVVVPSQPEAPAPAGGAGARGCGGAGPAPSATRAGAVRSGALRVARPPRPWSWPVNMRPPLPLQERGPEGDGARHAQAQRLSSTAPRR